MTLLKESKLEDITYQKVILKIITTSSIEKHFYDQLIVSDIKRYKELRKIITRQGEDYNTKLCWIMNASKIFID